MISFCAWCSLFPPLLSASMKTLKQMIHLQVGHHDLKTDDALKQGTSIYVACQCDCQHHMPVKCSQKFRVPGRVVYASSAACAAAAATVSKFRVSRVGCCYTLAHESVAFRVVVGLSGRFRMGWGRASGPGPGILPTWSEGPNLVRRSGLGVASYTWTCRVGASESQIPGKKGSLCRLSKLSNFQQQIVKFSTRCPYPLKPPSPIWKSHTQNSPQKFEKRSERAGVQLEFQLSQIIWFDFLKNFCSILIFKQSGTLLRHPK